MKKQDLSGVLLAGCVGVALLLAVAVRTFFPRIIIPSFDALAVIALSLIALVLDHYFVGSLHDFRLIPLYSALIFGIFPLVTGFVLPLEALKLAAIGAVACTAVTFIYDSLIDRLMSGPSAKAAPAISALGVYLAAQCLLGII